MQKRTKRTGESLQRSTRTTGAGTPEERPGARKLTMKELPVSERPYERLEKQGAFSLTDAQLLACLLSSGTKGERALDVAENLLHYARTNGPGAACDLASLCMMSLSDLQQVKGIGKVKAIQISAMFELSKRLSSQPARSGKVLSQPEDVAAMFYDKVRFLQHETVYAVYLTAKNTLIHDVEIGTGTLTASLVDLRSIFLKAYQLGAYGLIVVHSHPSGDPSPSRADRALTARLAQAGTILDVKVLDHIVIGDRKYYSFQENGFFRSSSGKQHA